MPFPANITWCSSIKTRTKTPKRNFPEPSPSQPYKSHHITAFRAQTYKCVLLCVKSMSMSSSVNYDLENGEIVKSSPVAKSLLRTRSQTDVLSSVRFRILRNFLANVRIVILGTKLFLLFPAIPMAFVAHYYSFRRVSDACSSFYVCLMQYLILIVSNLVFAAMGVCVEFDWANSTCRTSEFSNRVIFTITF